MKKIALMFVVVFLLGLVLSSCRSSQSCPAYNDYRQYQRERSH